MTFGGLIEMSVGLVLVYFLLSVFASGLSEMGESLVRRRPRFLEAGIDDLLGDCTERFYEHPLVQTLHPDRGRPRLGRKRPAGSSRKQKPSYIPSRVFSAAVLSLLTDGRTILRQPAGASAGDPPASGVLTPDQAIEEVERNLATLEDGPLKRSVGAFLASSGRDYDELRAELERWYDDKMDRVSGWYKRRTRTQLFFWGIVIATAFNADTIVLARTLYGSSTLRAGVAAAAQPCPAPTTAGTPGTTPGAPAPPAPATPTTPASVQCVADQLGSIRALGLPLGWSREGPAWPQGPNALWLKTLGLLITAAALTLGAPFWFDLFNKFVNVRSTGQPPAKHGEPARATQPPPGIGESRATRG